MSIFAVSFLCASDLADAARLEKSCFATFWSVEQFAEAYRQPSFAVYGIFLDSDMDKPHRMVGYIALQIAAEELEVLNIAVDASFRGNGYSEVLMHRALEDSLKGGHLRARGFPCGEGRCWTTAFLEVRVSNTPALALYKAMGFKISGLRRGYCSNGEDAFCMTLDAAAMPREDADAPRMC